eukprot:GHVS01095197.1.p1 GENE.GHVS01095197.1~~GHVS01095197.1.p1  ORF type:complete len:1064 (-),score=89.63 GHVS01095197.1:186-3377(-)
MAETTPNQSTLLIVIFSLLCGSALQWLISKLPAFPPPVSIVWFVFGMAVAALGDLGMGDLGKAIRSVGYMSSDVVYFMLLPILLYEATQNTNWHKFKRFLVAGLTLAVAGVAFQVGLLGVLFNFTFMNSLEAESSWPKSFLLASALASTDPVAVLSVLNNLNAPDKLCSMFDGESLINDGSSVLLFTLLFSVVSGDSENAAQAVFMFARLLFLGPLFGAALGFLMFAWLHFFRGHHLCQVIATVTVCYLSFYIAEVYFLLSGPLTCVCYGLFMKAYGHISLDREAQEKHHYLVDGAALVSNILIFVLSGILSYRMIGTSTGEGRVGPSADLWWQVFVIYVYLNISRLMMVLIFAPVLRWTGYGVSWKEAVLLVWGGLRGALVLALGLRIEESKSVSPEFSETATFFISGNVFLILLINGVTFELLYRLLNPYPPKPFRRVYLEKVMKMIDYQYMEEKQFLQSHWLFHGTDVLRHADRIVPVLGWRKLNKRGNLSIKTPSIHDVFKDISDDVVGRWNQFVTAPPDPVESTTPDGDGTLSALARKITMAEQGAAPAQVNFDPRYNLRLLERATANVRESYGDMPNSESETVCNNPATLSVHQCGCAATSIGLGCGTEEAVVDLDETSSVGSACGKRPSRFDTDATLIFDSTRNLHKLFDEKARTMLIGLDTALDDGKKKNLKLLGFRTGIYPEGSKTAARDRPKPLDSRLPPIMSKYRHEESPTSSKAKPLCLAKADEEDITSKEDSGTATTRGGLPRTWSGAILRNYHHHHKTPSREHGTLVRSSSFAESVRSLTSSVEYIEVPATPRHGSLDLDQVAEPANKHKVIRKEREGELYIMIFNACRQMYKKLYETHCIEGGSLLSLSTSLDISSDFAIGKLRQNPIRAWKDVLEETQTDQEINEALTSKLTGFQFEWRVLHSRFHCLHNMWLGKVPTKLLRTMLLFAACQSDLEQTVAYVEVHEELLDKGGANLKELLGKQLTKDYKEQIVMAKRFVYYIRERYPDSFKYVIIRIGAALLLNLKKALVNDQVSKGLLLEEDKNKLIEIFGQQEFLLTRWRPFLSCF